MNNQVSRALRRLVVTTLYVPYSLSVLYHNVYIVILFHYISYIIFKFIKKIIQRVLRNFKSTLILQGVLRYSKVFSGTSRCTQVLNVYLDTSRYILYSGTTRCTQIIQGVLRSFKVNSWIL